MLCLICPAPFRWLSRGIPDLRQVAQIVWPNDRVVWERFTDFNVANWIGAGPVLHIKNVWQCNTTDSIVLKEKW